MMATLKFSVGSPGDDLARRHDVLRGVSFEIRRKDLSLVARGSGVKQVELEGGAYHVFARHWSGLEHSTSVTLEASEQREIVLPFDRQPVRRRATDAKVARAIPTRERPRIAPEHGADHQRYAHADREFEDAARSHGYMSKGVTFPAVDLFDGVETPPVALDPPPVVVRLFEGNLFREEPRELPLPPHLEPEGGFDLPGGDRPRYIAFTRTGLPPLLHVVPAGPLGRASFDVHVEDNMWEIESRIANPIGNAIVSFLRSGEMGGAKSVLDDAEELMFSRFEDPLSAAVASCALLRMGALERLEHCTANLEQNVSWLPDGAAIHGEHLARRGNHEDALKSFLLILERGVPFLSDALYYATNRLRLLVRFEASVRPEAKLLLDKLAAIEPFIAPGDVFVRMPGDAAFLAGLRRYRT
jgi:hypothetical protein